MRLLDIKFYKFYPLFILSIALKLERLVTRSSPTLTVHPAVNAYLTCTIVGESLRGEREVWALSFICRHPSHNEALACHFPLLSLGYGTLLPLPFRSTGIVECFVFSLITHHLDSKSWCQFSSLKMYAC